MGFIVFTHPSCVLSHIIPSKHPESPDRIKVIMDAIQRTFSPLTYSIHEASLCSLDKIASVHSRKYIEWLESQLPQSSKYKKLDADTWLTPDSIDVARYASGAVVQGVDMLLNAKETTNKSIFCAIRPPGHHAQQDKAMGFCLFNHVAVGVAHALNHPLVKRVAILDFDAHQCNGTIDIFANTSDVLVCSIFEKNAYPYTFSESDFASNIINTPLSAGDGFDAFKNAIQTTWKQKLFEHKPDLIFLSAGFDAHTLDPLSDLHLSTLDYGWITRQIVQFAQILCGGRIVSVLEGGYHLQALQDSVIEHLKALS